MGQPFFIIFADCNKNYKKMKEIVDNHANLKVEIHNAIIVEVTGVGAGGSGGSGEGGGTGAPSLKFEVVSALPETGEDGIIYLVPTGETGDNKYEEWVWVNGSYEQMGTASLDLSGFAVLEGGNTFTGDQVIEGDVTVFGEVSTSDEFLRDAQIYLPAAIPQRKVPPRPGEACTIHREASSSRTQDGCADQEVQEPPLHRHP